MRWRVEVAAMATRGSNRRKRKASAMLCSALLPLHLWGVRSAWCITCSSFLSLPAAAAKGLGEAGERREAGLVLACSGS
jgi:hypothetical protein